MSENGQITKTYKGLTQLSRKKKNKQKMVQKQAEDVDRHLYKKNTQMANR